MSTNVTCEEELTQILNQYKRKQPEYHLILVPILSPDQKTVGFLYPVTSDFATTLPGCVEMLNRWRKDNPTLSPSRFLITHERTEKWINSAIINNDKRILFLIQDLDGMFVGHMGFTNIIPEKNSAEVDMVVRGEKKLDPGLMGLALKSLIRWGKEYLGLKYIDLVVLPYNKHGIAFYQRCGFAKDGIIPLIKVEADEEISWIRCQEPVAEPEYYFLHMALRE
ncbi:MAG: GNAT family N-acetyltransferase [Lachnospiraceae bacterium]|nr:GNAT family N-acetyltransferase [Lachnospiraceae bacterium]